MPRAFPFPLSIGTDICSIHRVLGILEKGCAGKVVDAANARQHLRFIRRILTEREIEETRHRWEGTIERWKRVEKLKGLLDWKRRGLGLQTNWLREKLRERGCVGALLISSEENGRLVMIAREGDIYNGVGDEQRSKQKGLRDLDILLSTLEQGDKEASEAARELTKVAAFIAGRFAAKEAAIKAHHRRRLTYHSIIIHQPSPPDPQDLDSITAISKGSQPPMTVIVSESGSWEDGQEVKISISHDGDYATAVCMAPEPKMGPI